MIPALWPLAGFNSSTVIFCIFGAIIHHFDSVTLKSVFIAYTALPVVIFISSVLLFPDRPFEPIRKNETERSRFKGTPFPVIRSSCMMSVTNGSSFLFGLKV